MRDSHLTQLPEFLSGGKRSNNGLNMRNWHWIIVACVHLVYTQSFEGLVHHLLFTIANNETIYFRTVIYHKGSSKTLWNKSRNLLLLWRELSVLCQVLNILIICIVWEGVASGQQGLISDSQLKTRHAENKCRFWRRPQFCFELLILRHCWETPFGTGGVFKSLEEQYNLPNILSIREENKFCRLYSSVEYFGLFISGPYVS